MSHLKLYEVRFPAEPQNVTPGVPEDIVCVAAPNVAQAIELARCSLKRGEWRVAVACQLIREEVVVQ